jgi:hypothetical protein
LFRALYSNGLDGTNDDLHNDLQLHQEVLMSYRLLFGQQRGSRKLSKSALTKLREESEAEYDGLLDLLCTQPCDREIKRLPLALWPVTCQSFEGFLQEESAYSSQDDFALFGERLAKLQNFILRQKPSRLRDFWRDRRNPLQWYTFWAVVIVGPITIILSLLQIAVAVAQLGFSTKAPQSCNCTLSSV